MDIARAIAATLGLPYPGVAAVLRLLDAGATIPFISRYRKEMTGSMDEVAVLAVSNEAQRLRQLEHRREYVLRTVEAAGALTDGLRRQIEDAADPRALEDLFAPYMPRRRTRATVAREAGLEPLAEAILKGQAQDPFQQAPFTATDAFPTQADALRGAQDIIAERLSDAAEAREATRAVLSRHARIRAALLPQPAAGKDPRQGAKYRDYDRFCRPLSSIPSHNLLALRRGQREGCLRVALEVADDSLVERLERLMTPRGCLPGPRRLIEDAVVDGYTRLLRPSMENDVMAAAKERADTEAIAVFTANLRQLLMAPPLPPGRRVMGIDPGYRTGCKVVCLDQGGALLAHDVIFPAPPRNQVEGAELILQDMVQEHQVDAIAIGNGTASRETQDVVRAIRFCRPVEVYVVSEDGASVYSASEAARAEFPDQDVTVRGAVSIARRLLDPLAELVKIDPKSIGVGQYQHDVDQGALARALDFVVESCVNQVGVNVNTASARLLSYVAGIGPAMAAKIVAHRTAHGPFLSRRGLLDVRGLGPKCYEQCAGFMRIPSSQNPLDNTAVHPEDYATVEAMAADLGATVADLLAASPQMLERLQLERYVTDGCGLPTLTDILQELRRPGRDPRGEARQWEFDPSVRTPQDVQPGMELPGVVENVTAFGAFVDIGVHRSGLVHVSQLPSAGGRERGRGGRRGPARLPAVGEHVRVRVLDVDPERGRISLTMKGVQQP